MTKTELRQVWASQVANFKASGMTTNEWCQAHDLKIHQLRYWIRKFRDEANSSSLPSQWLGIDIKALEPKSPSNVLTLRVGQVTLEVKPGVDQVLLSDVVRTILTIC